MSLKNMKIGSRIALTGGILIVFLAIVSIYSLYEFGNMNDHIQKMANDRFPKTVQANIIIDDVNVIARSIRNMILLDETLHDEIIKQDKRIDKASSSIKVTVGELEKVIKSGKGIELLTDLKDNEQKAFKEIAMIRDYALKHDVENAEKLLFGEYRKLQADYVKAIENLIEYQGELMHEAARDADDQLSQATMLIIGLLVVCIIIAVILVLMLTKSINNPINKCVEGAKKIAAGNLNVDLEAVSEDETGILLNSMKSMKVSIENMIKETNSLSEAATLGKLDHRGDTAKFKGEFATLIGGINETLDAVISPLNVTAEYVDRISKGDIPPKITDEYNGDFNEIKNNLNLCIDVMNGLLGETNDLVIATKKGKLDKRGDAGKYTGDWQKLISGVNDLIDAFVGPINVTAEYVDRISKGDIPPRIVDEYQGDFNEIKNNLNLCIDVMNGLLSETGELINAATNGKLDKRGNKEQFIGSWKDLIGGVNDLIDAFVGPINVTAEYVDRISKGDIPPKITDEYNGDFNEIKNNLNLCIDSINELVSDVDLLIVAAGKEEFDTRADADKHSGNYKDIVNGINKTLELVAGKLYIYEASLDSLPFPVSITDMDMNWIFFNRAVSEITGLDRSQMLGKQCSNWNADICNSEKCGIQLLRKGSPTSYFKQPGLDQDFKVDTTYIVDNSGGQIGHIEIIQDVTATNRVREYMDKEVNKLAENLVEFSKGNLSIDTSVSDSDKYTEETRKKFLVIKEAIDESIRSVGDVLGEVNTMVGSVVKGALDKRGNKDQFNGEWQTLIGGVNDLIDAFVGPINVTAEYVDRISKGDIPPRIVDEYHGDFNEIKNNLNQCIDIMTGLLGETNNLVEATKAGKLDKRGDKDRFTGDWQALIGGVNDLIDAFVGPINVTAEYVDRISKGDIPPRIVDEYHGDFNEIKNNLNLCIDVMNGLVSETEGLINAATNGKLDMRGDKEQFVGSWKELIGGVNDLIDAFVGPINVTAEYVDRISKGDIPPRIVDEYKGDFNEIKNNLNVCIEAITSLVSDANMLAKAGSEGRLRIRANADKHGGDFRNIIAGVNNTLDAVVGLLDNLPIPAMGIDSDFNIVYMNNTGASISGKNGKDLEGIKCYDYFKTEDCKTQNCACHRAMQTKSIASSETSAQPVPGVDLEISYSGIPIKDDKGNAIGAFEVVMDQTEIKTAMNRNNKIAEYQAIETNKLVEALEMLAEGDFSAHVDLNDPDDDTSEAFDILSRILSAIRKFTNAVFQLQDDVKQLSGAAVEGNLAHRADTVRHNGDFRTLVEGLNATLDFIIEPVNEANEILSFLAQGDLTVKVSGDYKGDHKKLKESMNHLSDSLANVISRVRASVESVSSASIETSSTAEAMAAASQEQSSQADEVASAVEEMSRTITENAMAAGRTAEVAEKNGSIAKDGGDVVEQTINKMKDIASVVHQSAENIEKLGESSKKIGEIISVIDDIADQTNLLALNAAIEAARAGEQGRGFAVVADEVRKLAERTTEATKQIASMIKGIQAETEVAVKVMTHGNEEVKSGIELADRAGNALEQVVGSSQEVLDMINQIAAASEEQSSTSEQISQNVMAISKVTADSARRVEEIAGASEGIAKLSEELAGLMAAFKIADSAYSLGSGSSGMVNQKLEARENKMLTGYEE